MIFIIFLSHKFQRNLTKITLKYNYPSFLIAEIIYTGLSFCCK